MVKRTIALTALSLLCLFIMPLPGGDDKGQAAQLLTAEILLKVAAANQALDLIRSETPKILFLYQQEDSSSRQLALEAAEAFGNRTVSARSGIAVEAVVASVDSIETVNIEDFAMVVMCGLTAQSRDVVSAICIANRILTAGFGNWESQMMVAVGTDTQRLSPRIQFNWPLLELAEIPLPVELLQFNGH